MGTSSGEHSFPKEKDQRRQKASKADMTERKQCARVESIAIAQDQFQSDRLGVARGISPNRLTACRQLGRKNADSLSEDSSGAV
jgi:predicted PilT family ATPase